jgi:hypothetical protein
MNQFLSGENRCANWRQVRVLPDAGFRTPLKPE